MNLSSIFVIFKKILFLGSSVYIAERRETWMLLGSNTKKEVDFRPCLHKHRYCNGIKYKGDISVPLV